MPMMEHVTTEENRPTDGIEGIAVRIHERAVQLLTEREFLRHSEQQLRELKVEIERENEINQTVRARYLQNVTKMNSIEMECIQMEASIKERMKKAESLKENEKEILASHTQSNADWNNTEQALTRHTLRQELYMKVLQGVIYQQTQAISRRKSRLETTAKFIEELKQKENFCIQTQCRIKVDTKRIIDAEESENKVIDSLASQVRDALTKVRRKTVSPNVIYVYCLFLIVVS